MATLLGSIVLSACQPVESVDEPSNRPAAAANACHAQVVMTFAQNLGERPADPFVTSISQAADVMLAFVRTAGPGLYVFQLDADGADEDCGRALERLRRDERVRSVDVDQRRHVQAQGTAAPDSFPARSITPS